MPVTIPRFTVDDLAAFPDDGNRYELLDGILLVSPSPGAPHQVVATRIAVLLANFLKPWPELMVSAPGVIIVRPQTQLEPDVLVFRRPPGKLHWESVREHLLAVEVTSVSTQVYEREYKRPAYLALGVPEVWRVDPEAERVLVSRLGAPPDVAHAGRLTWRPRGLAAELAVDLDEVVAGLTS